jgi:hypothetical protein
LEEKLSTILCISSSSNRITDLEGFIGEYEVTDSTASDACWALAHQWYTNCIRNHPACNQVANKEAWFPSRLIETGTADNPLLRLRITNEIPPDGPYLTLSHCWGTASIFKLTTSNLDQMKDNIAIMDLPKAFQDAIFITRRLGIRYLWVDSLCILQDSIEDWRAESALMGDVYRNSVCNIAATGASNSEEGCFVERSIPLVQPCRTNLAWNGPQEIPYLVANRNFWEENLSDAPLNRRAWVIQERLLAPRVLHFGREQLFWECHMLDACETYPKGLPSCLSSVHTRFKGLDPDIDGKRRQVDMGLEPDPTLSAHHLWGKS